MNGYNTQKRSQLMAYLKRHQDESLTVSQISSEMEGIDVSTVYRNLAALVEKGEVQKSIKVEGHTAVYRYHDRSACASRLHLRCTGCGRVIHMDAALSENLLQKVRQCNVFDVDTRHTEILGLCESCR